MAIKKIWPLARETVFALYNAYYPAVDQAAEPLGLANYQWLVLPSALNFDPDAISAERLRVRTPYNTAEAYERFLTPLLANGYVEVVDGGYRLTAAGRAAAGQLLAAGYEKQATMAPLPAADLEQLAVLLHRLVAASLAAPEPPNKSSLLLSRRVAPPAGSPPLTRIDAHLTDLNAFRDDCHLATWRPYAVSAAAWEAFTLIWRGSVRTLEQLSKKLAARGHGPEGYARALRDLVQRGWLAEQDGIYQLTQGGQQLREAVEAATDAAFYPPWQTLSAAELDDLETLLQQLRDALHEK